MKKRIQRKIFKKLSNQLFIEEFFEEKIVPRDALAVYKSKWSRRDFDSSHLRSARHLSEYRKYRLRLEKTGQLIELLEDE